MYMLMFEQSVLCSCVILIHNHAHMFDVGVVVPVTPADSNLGLIYKTKQVKN